MHPGIPRARLVWRFSGTVTKVHPKTFEVLLQDQTRPELPDEWAEFPSDVVPDRHLSLVHCGAPFTLVIVDWLGDGPRGTFLFRNDLWTAGQIKKARREAKRLARLLLTSND